MRGTAFFLACLLASAAGAQTQKSEEKRTERTEPAPRLNLKLDNPAQFVRETPPAEPGKGTDALPSLGGNAVTLERPAAPRVERPSPYPKDVETGR